MICGECCEIVWRLFLENFDRRWDGLPNGSLRQARSVYPKRRSWWESLGRYSHRCFYDFLFLLLSTEGVEILVDYPWLITCLWIRVWKNITWILLAFSSYCFINLFDFLSLCTQYCRSSLFFVLIGNCTSLSRKYALYPWVLSFFTWEHGSVFCDPSVDLMAWLYIDHSHKISQLGRLYYPYNRFLLVSWIWIIAGFFS